MTDLARKFAGAETTATTRLTCCSLQGLGAGSASTVISWGLTNTCRVLPLPLTPPPAILTNASLMRGGFWGHEGKYIMISLKNI